MEWWGIWLIIAGVLLVIEMLTLTFYLLWVALGAAAAAIVDLFFRAPIWVELLVGCVVVLILTIFTKPLTRRFRQSRGYQDAVDELVGKQGIVLESIAEGAPGIVKVGNETWSAVANRSIEKGKTVIVLSRGSAVLHVEEREGE
ncbi:NfeD family protein [Paenibacillus harenae]|uniref:NfeD family protein n=1 Tax=Paenibacillus harenae TaxID=306543 RepID=UPI00278DE984|nr:NfeD family protein [Paenibacillus harenae]MDQ0060642.1 membrane protein implicated in regulation of membrane protease activity [Paenibacillus harenae]